MEPRTRSSISVLSNLAENCLYRPEELAAASLHKPNLECDISSDHVEQRLRRARVVVGAEDGLAELLFVHVSEGHVEGMQVRLLLIHEHDPGSREHHLSES